MLFNTKSLVSYLLPFRNKFGCLSGVLGVQLRSQDGGMIETFAANFASEGPFARVNQQMALEIVWPSEPLLANFAFKWPFPSMGPQMTFEVSQKAWSLCADVALEFLHSVYPLFCVKRLVSFSLDPSSRTAGTATGRRGALPLGDRDSS